LVRFFAVGCFLSEKARTYSLSDCLSGLFDFMYLFSTPIFEVLRASHYRQPEALRALAAPKIDGSGLTQASLCRRFTSIFRGAE
jgi:hypothetical protein